ncbi:unnamed protein product [Urochloa humidicola]
MSSGESPVAGARSGCRCVGAECSALRQLLSPTKLKKFGSPFKSLSTISWNIRGLNDSDKCAAVKLALPSPAPSIIALQETKLDVVPSYKA